MAYSDLIISEYIEGSSNNKAVEIFNGTGASIDLAAAGYRLQMYFNGSASAGLTITLTGTVASGDVYVVAQSAASATILAQADQTNGSGWFNGDDAVVLSRNGAVVDVIGQVGFDPGSEWGTGLVSTADNTLRRLDSVLVGDTVATDVFNPATGWDGFATDTFGDLGRYTPAVSDTVLVSVATVDAAANETGADSGSFRITRSGPATSALTVDFTLGGSAGPDDYAAVLHPVTIPAGAAFVDVTVTPVDDIVIEGDETVTLSLIDGAAFDLGAAASASLTLADNDVPPTLIHDIQGSGSASPLTGQTVTVEAIVVGDFQGSSGLQGFFVQEEDAQADGDAATSEGLFIFQGSGGTPVQVGDKVLVTGRVIEFGNGFSSLTELSPVNTVTVLSSGHPLPAATTVSFPLANAASLEALEGMRVTIPTTLTVTETFTLGRFGEVLLSSDGPGNQPGTDARLDQYTQFNVPDVDGYATYLETIAGRRLLLDDGNGQQNRDPIVYGRNGDPLSADNTLRGGDIVSGLSGIIDERFGTATTGAYRLQPTADVDFQAVNARGKVPDTDGRIEVASFNVLNFFNGPLPNPRGANSLLEFAHQQAKIVAAIVGLDAEVVGLIELENDGYGPGSAISSLVDAVNKVAGVGTYAYIDPGVSELGGDDIAVGLIYKVEAVTPMGAAAILDGSVDPRFDSSVQRPSLAQTFRYDATGALFTPVINHLKSKGTAANLPGDLDQGDGQGFSNATRTLAAKALADWLATDPTGQGDTDYVVLGDLNAYAMEDPLQALRAGSDDQAGTADDLADLVDASSYSYAFSGQWGSLDHALASGSLLGQVTGAAKWHINADEPTALDYNTEFKSEGQVANLYAPTAFRSSDHDPVVVGLNPGLVLQGGPAADRLSGSIGNDVLRGGGAHDVLTGNDGSDTFVFDSLQAAHDTITDFEVGLDRLDIDGLLAAVDYTGSNPVGDGYLRVLVPAQANPGRGAAADRQQTLVFFDADGGDGEGGHQLIAQLTGVMVIDAALLLDTGP